MRYYGFDLIRLISFAAIVWWHYAYALWEGQVSRNPLASESLLWHITGQVSLFLAFSGFSIIVLSSFLTGFVGRKVHQLKFVGFFLLGWLLFALVGRLVYGAWFFEWDIYPFLIVSFLSLRWVSRLRGVRLWVAAAAGFVISLIPFWQFEFFNSLPAILRALLVGASQGEALGQWPLLPFIGLVWCFYALGRILQKHMQPEGGAKFAFLPWRGWEWALWTPLLGAGCFCLGAYMKYDINVHLDAQLYRLPPYQLWGQLLWVVFLMRVSLLQAVQGVLGRIRVLRWVGQLQVSRNFWALYVVHYLVIFLVVFMFKGVIASSVWGSFAFLLLVPLASELIVSGARRLMRVF